MVESTSSVRKPRKSRSRGLRTSAGCLTCRKRRVKCDETRPSCRICARSSRECVYSTPAKAGPSVIGSGNSSSDLPQIQEEHDLDEPVGPPKNQAQLASRILNVCSAEAHSISGSHRSECTAPTSTIQLRDDALNEEIESPSVDGLDGTLLSQQDLARSDVLASTFLSIMQSPSTRSVDRRGSPSSSRTLQKSAQSPGPVHDLLATVEENHQWRCVEPIQLTDQELVMFHHFVIVVSVWLDLFDPLHHISAVIPHLALYNEGLMNAVLALGAKHLSTKAVHGQEADFPSAAACQYHQKTMQYLQGAMRYASYKNSQELLATLLLVSTYEMMQEGKGWERHLKGLYWTLRSRDIDGGCGGLEQAIWWAWLRQDTWAAFRKRRRCFAIFESTLSYEHRNMFEAASRVVYILAQVVNYCSDEEKQKGENNLDDRFSQANRLLQILDEWRASTSAHFQPFPTGGHPDGIFEPLWIHPPPLATALQMHSMARLLLLIHQPAAGGHMEYLRRDKMINECIDTIAGVAMKTTEDASRLMSVRALFVAGLYCTHSRKRDRIIELIEDCQAHTGWPAHSSLAEELRREWGE